MSINFNRDYFNQMESPPFILCKGNRERIGEIFCINEKKILFSLDMNELNFSTPMYVDGVLNDIYGLITELKYIFVPEIGYFVISSVDEDDDGINPTKTVNAKSEEYNLGQRYLEEFYINNGEDYGINGVCLYDEDDPDHSLLDLVIKEKCPEWSVGHVDESIASKERWFEEERTDVYSFLKDSLCESFSAVIMFDTINMTINVFDEETFGVDSDVFVTYQNLLKNTSLSSSVDDIKTCLTVTGADDINLREVNMGSDRIYMFDYYVSDEYMSHDLVTAYNNWKIKVSNNKPTYTQLVFECQDLYEQINYLENLKMPETLESTDWTQYGLNPLLEKQKIYEGKQSVAIKAGQAEETHPDYETIYLPIYYALEGNPDTQPPTIGIKDQITVVRGQLATLYEMLETKELAMNVIANDCAMDNEENFSAAQMIELSKFIREDSINSDNYIITDTMTESERIDMLYDMLDYGTKELQKISQPQIQFDASLLNLFNMPEFDSMSNLFDCGNYIHVIIRDDYVVKARLLSIEIDFLNLSELPVTFSTLNKLKDKSIFADITKAINNSTSASTTVAVKKSTWNSADKTATELDETISNGTLAAGESFYSKNKDIIIDDRGILLYSKDQTYPDDVLMLGASQISFSDDNLKTVKEALGRVSYIDKRTGETKSIYGLIAQMIKSGYIDGTDIIIGGNGLDGSIVMLDENNEEKGRWDKTGLYLPAGTTLSWDDISNKPYVPTVDDYQNKYFEYFNHSIVVVNGQEVVLFNTTFKSAASTQVQLMYQIILKAETYTDGIDFNDVLVTVRCYYDDSLITNWQVKETYQDGYHTIHGFYNVTVNNSEVHDVKITMETSGGLVRIGTREAMFTINGQQLMGEYFDGKIDITQEIGIVSLDNAIPSTIALGIVDAGLAEVQVPLSPVPVGYTDVITLVSNLPAPSSVSIVGLTEELDIDTNNE